jgi:hypothetical protein
LIEVAAQAVPGGSAGRTHFSNIRKRHSIEKWIISMAAIRRIDTWPECRGRRQKRWCEIVKRSRECETYLIRNGNFAKVIVTLQ